MRGNRTLEKLTLNGNRISPETIIEIEEMLSGNKGRPEQPMAPQSFTNKQQPLYQSPSFAATGPIGARPGIRQPFQ